VIGSWNPEKRNATELSVAAKVKPSYKFKQNKKEQIK
jgi:hypothetical protein